MDEMLYNALSSYYHVLEKTGYMSFTQSQKLLILNFYRDFVFNDYRGVLSKEDYYLIERALDCLYGSTCLIPYPDYLKMGKLHIGETTEMAYRLKELEDTNVLKLIHNTEDAIGDIDSDVMVVVEDDEEE